MKASRPRHPAFCTIAAGLRCRRGSRNRQLSALKPQRTRVRWEPRSMTAPWNCASIAPCRKMNRLRNRPASTSRLIRAKVLLTGQSPTPDLSARAKQIAMGVEGTTEVFNEVRQGQPIGLGTASSDTWITTKVRSQLLSTDQVKSSNVKVTTENSEVFLMGLVTEREGRAAADIASRVSGVSRVTTAFTYIK